MAVPWTHHSLASFILDYGKLNVVKKVIIRSQRTSSVASSIDKFLPNIPERLSTISIRSQQSSDDHDLPTFLGSKETETLDILFIRHKVLERFKTFLEVLIQRILNRILNTSRHQMMARFL